MFFLLAHLNSLAALQRPFGNGLIGAPAGSTVPEQVHIAFAGADDMGHSTGYRVSWYTAAMAPSVVQYGTSPSSLNSSVAGQAAYGYLKDSGFHHTVAATGFPASTRVFYRAGSPSGGWTDVFSFKTAPPPTNSTTAGTFSVSVFGDMGWLDSTARPMVITIAGLVKHWSATVSRDRLEALKDVNAIDWIWHLGDIGYIDDAFAHHPLGFHYELAYNGFMNWLQNLTSQMAYMVSPGNHESECHSPGCISEKSRANALRNFSAYNARWHMPSGESGARANSAMWYSFNYGNVHFVSFNSETDWDGAEEEHEGDSHNSKLPSGGFGADGEYLAWLEADLKRFSDVRETVRNGTAPPGTWAPTFLVVGGHRPPGDLDYKGVNVHKALFEKYGVDLYLAGHGHSYSRSDPVNGITYIMAGGAGCDEMTYIEDPLDVQIAKQAETPGWAVPLGSEAFKTGRVAIGVLTVNATAMHFKLLDSKDGSQLDQTTILASVQETARDARRLAGRH